jgi:hypothetical protein
MLIIACWHLTRQTEVKGLLETKLTVMASTPSNSPKQVDRLVK